MRGARTAPPQSDWLVLVVLAALVIFWASGELAGVLASGTWPEVGLVQTVRAATKFPSHLSDPTRAWPPGALPAPLAPAGLWWACAGAVGCLVVLPAGAIGRRARRPPGKRKSTGARWGRWGDTGPLRVGTRAAQRRGRLILGRMDGGRRRRGALLATEARHSVLVLGPTQSGKTTGLAVPAVLEWRGPVVATSVKDDLALTTSAWRAGHGPTWVFDPTAQTALPGVAPWSPLSKSATWTDAQRMATWLVEATPGRQGMADAAFWYATAAKQLAPLLLAASCGGLGMRDVVRWTNAGDFDEPARLLEVSGEDEAALAIAAAAGRDERIRSSVGTTLETVLAPFEDPDVAAATECSSGCAIDPAELLATNGTIYLCGPSHEQARVQGLFAALVSTVVAEAHRRVSATGRPLDPPLLLVLDEAANIAPVRDLDTLASTGAGLGIQLVTICQDLSQLATRYGQDRARTIANNHRAKLLLSGVSDIATLDLVSALAGETLAREESRSEDLTDGRRTRSTSRALRRLAPTDELRRIPPGRGVLVYGHLPPVRLRLRPWFTDRRLRRVTGP